MQKTLTITKTLVATTDDDLDIEQTAHDILKEQKHTCCWSTKVEIKTEAGTSVVVEDIATSQNEYFTTEGDNRAN